MTRDAKAAAALICGSVAILATMAFHPTGADTLHNAGAGAPNTLARGVHALAIGAMPLLLAGMLAVTWRLRARAELAVLAYAAYALGVVAVMMAAAMSGFIATSLADRVPTLSGAARDAAMQQFHYTGTLNQAFAKIYVCLAGSAFLLWSVAMRDAGGFPRALAWFGLVAGAMQLVAIASGKLPMNVHGFGAVVLLQSIWVLWVARVLTQQTAPDSVYPTPAVPPPPAHSA
jgi:hypothetical protein